MAGVMRLLLLLVVSHNTSDRKHCLYLACQSVHICVALRMYTDAVFSVFFFNVESQVLRNGLNIISGWLEAYRSRSYLMGRVILIFAQPAFTVRVRTLLCGWLMNNVLLV